MLSAKTTEHLSVRQCFSSYQCEYYCKYIKSYDKKFVQVTNGYFSSLLGNHFGFCRANMQKSIYYAVWRLFRISHFKSRTSKKLFSNNLTHIFIIHYHSATWKSGDFRWNFKCNKLYSLRFPWKLSFLFNMEWIFCDSNSCNFRSKQNRNYKVTFKTIQKFNLHFPPAPFSMKCIIYWNEFIGSHWVDCKGRVAVRLFDLTSGINPWSWRWELSVH